MTLSALMLGALILNSTAGAEEAMDWSKLDAPSTQMTEKLDDMLTGRFQVLLWRHYGARQELAEAVQQLKRSLHRASMSASESPATWLGVADAAARIAVAPGVLAHGEER